MYKGTWILGLISLMKTTQAIIAQSPPEITGRLSLEQLRSEALNTWFAKPKSLVMPDSALLRQDHSHLKAVLVLGTWCEDSHRYVPEIIDYLSRLPGFSRLDIYAVGRDKLCPECPPNARPDRIPLLVINRNDVELGRMVEQPPGTVKAFLDTTLLRP